MTLAEFLVWDAPGPENWQLVDGEPTAMAPASAENGAIQMELGRLIGNHLVGRGSTCRVIGGPGVIPRVRANNNMRVPDLAVSCTPYELDGHALSEPVLVIEILSPSNKAETWSNVGAYTTVPRLREIAVFHSVKIGVELLRRGADGSWPEQPESIESGDMVFESIEFRFPLEAAYRTTRLNSRGD